MLKLFKTHFALIPFLLILTLMVFLRVDVLFSSYKVDLWEGNIAPFSQLYLHIVGNNLIYNRIFNAIFSAFIVFILSGTIISIFSVFRNKDLKSFLPAWVFVLLMHLHPSFIFISPQLLSFTFVLLAFRKLIIYIHNPKEHKALFEIGILIGIATMFWAPSILFFLMVFFYLFKNLKLSLKSVISLFFSFCIPVLYVIAYYILFEKIENSIIIFSTLTFNTFNLKIYPINQLMSSIVTVFLFLISIYYTIRFVKKELIDIKSLFSLIFFYTFNVIVVLIFQNTNTFSILIFLLFPLAVFLSILFNRIKQNVYAEYIHLVLLLTIIVNFMYFT